MSSSLYKYSQRLLWNTSANPLARLIESLRHSGVPLLDLTVSNPTEFLAGYPHSAIRDAYARIDNFSYKPDPCGMTSAREAVAALYHRRGFTVEPDRLLLTASSSEAYALLLKMLCDPGEEILAPLPSYPLFEYLAAAEGVRIVPYRLAYDGAWFIDFANLWDAITTRTRAIVIVNPNNPTGSFLKRSECAKLLRIAESHRLPLIADEVFFEYGFGNDAERVNSLAAADSALSFSLDGISKTAGMPQMKLGWIAVNGPRAERERAQRNLEMLLDTYLSVGTAVQKALPDLIEIGSGIRQKIRRQTAENLETLGTLLHGTPAHALLTEGGWSAIIRLPSILPEEAWAEAFLTEAGVIVQPGYFFEMASEPFIVVSLATSPDQFTEGFKRCVATICKKVETLPAATVTQS